MHQRLRDSECCSPVAGCGVPGCSRSSCGQAGAGGGVGGRCPWALPGGGARPSGRRGNGRPPYSSSSGASEAASYVGGAEACPSERQTFGSVHDFEVEAIGVIIEALRAEHPYLSQMVIGPVVDFIHEVSVYGQACPRVWAWDFMHEVRAVLTLVFVCGPRLWGLWARPRHMFIHVH